MDGVIRQDICSFFTRLIGDMEDLYKDSYVCFNVRDAGDIRKYLGGPSGLFDTITDIKLIRRGYFGSIYGIQICISRIIPIGFYVIIHSHEYEEWWQNKCSNDLILRPIGYRCGICNYQNWGPANRHTKTDCNLRVTDWVMTI